jgi:hypothetical protein
MADKGLSDKEAVLIAAAKREAAARPSPAPVPAVPPSAAPAPAKTAAAVNPAADIYERMARLMEAERRETELRKARMKRNGTALVVVFLAPIILWALVTLVRQMLRH